MLLAEVLKVDGQSRSTPDKLEIHLSLVVVKGFEYPPESSDNWGVGCAVAVGGDGFELLNI